MNKVLRLVLIQISIFASLLIIAELGLRLLGYKAGVIDNFYYHKGDLIHDSALYADEMGISHLSRNARFFSGFKINDEGFGNDFEYEKNDLDSLRSVGEKIVFLIGDSYTHGCCPKIYQQSYASRLNASKGIAGLNFGIGAADPLHYELIAKKYAPQLHPDLICVFVYLGNDIVPFERIPMPYIPLAYTSRNGGPWLKSMKDIDLYPENTYLKSFDEAKQYFYHFYSLWNPELDGIEKYIRHSVIASRIYLGWRHFRKRMAMKGNNDSKSDKEITNTHLRRIHDIALKNDTKALFFAIPSPIDIASGINLKEEYEEVFEGVNSFFPQGLKISDYDGPNLHNHFNKNGHLKFTDFAKPIIYKELDK